MKIRGYGVFLLTAALFMVTGVARMVLGHRAE